MTDTPTDPTPNVYRVHRRAGGYVHVPNEVANDDQQLSYKALGLLVYMLGRPDGWAFHRDRLARGVELGAVQGGRTRAAREGREAVATALRELTAAGYYRTQRVRVEGGRWATVTEVTDTPGEWPSS